jgi:hypothetical protein
MILFLIGNLFLISCVQESEVPTAIRSESGQLAKIKAWFEENESKLRLSGGGTNLRVASQELILPFFEKEPDWDQFHHYYFPDGREVFEISLANATKYFPTTMLDSFPNRNPAEVVIQNILFIKHPTEERFDPVIARYYPDNKYASKEFKEISYDGIPHDWSGKVDIWTYDERHFIGFTFEQGELVSNSRYLSAGSSEKSRIAGDCRTLIREISANYVGKDGVVVVRPPIVIVEVICSGAGGYTPQGGNGGDYFDYNRPTCCEDPSSGSSSDGSGYNPPRLPKPGLINKLTNPCADEVFRGLKKTGIISPDQNETFAIDQEILKLFEESSNYDFIIQNTDNPNQTTPRFNHVTRNREFIVNLNNNYLNVASQLSIARTIIHESLHAYISYKLDADLDYKIEFERDYIEYIKNNRPHQTNRAQHELMAKYVETMAYSLKQWDKVFGNGKVGNPLLGDEYYRAMAFAGLTKSQSGLPAPTDSFKELVPSGAERMKIMEIIQNEQDGTNEAKGTKCN